MTQALLDMVRQRAAEVAEQAEQVWIATDALPRYAATLPQERLTVPEMDPKIHCLGEGEATLAYFLTLDAVNFGSGYFPEVLGDPRVSGYRTVAAALTEYFRANGPIPAQGLSRLTPAECAGIFRLDLVRPLCRELMELFARALTDLGNLILREYGGEFAKLVEAAGGQAERLVELVTAMPLFRDEALYRGRTVPFLKRAQLLAVDLFIAFHGEGAGNFHDLDRLTICADNLVPHVLRHDGILLYRQDLARRIDGGMPIPAGSPEEVEIRGCALHAAELLVGELRGRGLEANAMLLDNFLWHRGQESRYRQFPRHRTRTVFY